MWTPQELTNNQTQLRNNAGEAERHAASRAKLRVGSWRERVFRAIVDGAHTSYEIHRRLAEQAPCQTCGCTHRGPKPINEIGARLGELRDMGLVRRRVKDSGKVVTLDIGGGLYEVHVLTVAGIELAESKYRGRLG